MMRVNGCIDIEMAGIIPEFQPISGFPPISNFTVHYLGFIYRTKNMG